MASLQPVVFELRVESGDDAPLRLSEVVTIERDGDPPSDKDWLATVATAPGNARPGVVAAGDSPSDAAKNLAATLRAVADEIEPIHESVKAMIRGLVRAAEFKEQEDNGRIWDTQCRDALEMARSLGWGLDRVGTLGR